MHRRKEAFVVKCQVILADNQAIFRAGIVRVLSGESDLQLVAQCADATSLRDSIARAPNAIVVFPSSFIPHLDEVFDWIEQAGSRAILIVEHGVTPSQDILDRANGVVLRSVAGPQLLDCIRRVAAGQRSVQRANAKSAPTPDRVGARVLERLTPKELQIIALVTEGAKNKEIAAQLGTKEQVVKNYLRTIYDKTGVSDRLELALFTVHHRALAEATEQLRLERTKPV